MLPLLMMAGIAILFRGLGRSGWRGGRTMSRALLHAMSVTFVITGAAFLRSETREDMARMLPPETPAPRVLVSAAGVVQMAGGVALAVPPLRIAGAVALGALVAAKIPANLRATREGLTVRSPLPTPPALRMPIVVVWILILTWAGVRKEDDGKRRGGTGRPGDQSGA